MSRKLPNIDERSRRTRNALAEALIRLSRDKSVDSISIGELAAAAGIGRSTFYTHFRGMPEFLRESFANMLERSVLHARAAEGAPQVLPVAFILQHLASSGGFGAVISRSKEWPGMIAAGRERLGRLIEGTLASLHPEIDPRTRRWAAVFIAGGFMAIIQQWTDGGRRESAEFLECQFEVFLSGVLAALAGP
jgi:AcrR family transcriptional regulator